MTWAQVWTVASNAAIRALDPLLAAINWVANNIQTVVPIVISLGTAFGVLLIAANWTNILAFASEKASMPSWPQTRPHWPLPPFWCW